MFRVFKFLSSCSFLGVIRYMRLRVMGKELLVSGSCLCCGNCCRNINLESSNGWLRSARDFNEMVDAYPEYARFQITGKDKQGYLQFSCSWLDDKGFCKDHENRLSLCKNFPDKNLHFCGGSLLQDCGYHIAEVRPFSCYLADEIKEREKNETSPHP